jgi:hypothetical protein
MPRPHGHRHRKAALGDLADALGRLNRCGADAELVALLGGGVCDF